MKRSIAGSALAFLAAAFVVTGTGGAAAQRTLTMKLGDVLDIVDTRMVCTSNVGRTTLFKGKKVLSCAKADDQGPRPGSFTAAIGVDGTVALGRIDDRREIDVVFSRKLASATLATRTIRVRPGDQARLAGTDVWCGIVSGSGETQVACFRTNAQGRPLPRTYGILLSDTLAAIVRFDGRGKARPLFRRTHGD